jgi:hypothetical protein
MISECGGSSQDSVFHNIIFNLPSFVDITIRKFNNLRSVNAHHPSSSSMAAGLGKHKFVEKKSSLQPTCFINLLLEIINNHLRKS